MKNLLFSLIFGFTLYNCSAQQLPRFLTKDTIIDHTALPLFVIIPTNNIPVKYIGYDFSGLMPNDITKIEVLKGNDGVNTYGKAALNGVVVIYIRQKIAPSFTKLPGLKEFFKEYSIKRKDRKLCFIIDSALVKQPCFHYFDFAIIKSVKIDTEKVSGIRFINVRTNKPITHYKKGTIMIRGLASN